MKFPAFLFKPTERTTAKNAATSAWPWAVCGSSPRTFSFRANDETTAAMFKTINSAYVQEIDDDDDHSADGNDSSDNIVLVTEGLLRSSDRLFFEPGETNSILEEVNKAVQSEDQGVTAMAMDSIDPFVDFRVSMEEMVIARRLRRWECLEDLLVRYLQVNAKSNHRFIIGAFVDLLSNLSLADCGDEQRVSSCSCSIAVMNQDSFTSPLSFCSSSCSLIRSPSSREGLVASEKISSNSCSSSSVSCKHSSFSSGFYD